MPYSDVYNCVNNFFEFLLLKCRIYNRNFVCESMDFSKLVGLIKSIDTSETCELNSFDNVKNIIIDNGIIIFDYNWSENSENNKKIYEIIFKKFNSENIIWLKFTNKGHIGAIGNFNKNSAYKNLGVNFDDVEGKRKICSSCLVKAVGEEWNKDFIFMFPISNEVLRCVPEKERNGMIKSIKKCLSDYLKLNGIPIIDYKSADY